MIRGGAPKGQARAALVLAHGRGGSAADILGLLDAAELEGVAGFAPEAPGHSWWPTSFLAPMAQMQAPLDRALAAMAAGVAAAEAEGIARRDIWLGGFSQGACLALEAYARAGQGLGGVLAFSGGLIGTADAEGPADPALYGARPKRLDYAGPLDGTVWLSVHQQDPHIPLARVQESAQVLQRLGATVHLRVDPGAGHAVMRQDLAALRQALG